MRSGLIQVHRVNWLRAKATFDRANEENVLVMHEMKWTVNYFQYHARWWEERKEAAASYGHKIYAARKEGMWRQFANGAACSFLAVGVEM